MSLPDVTKTLSERAKTHGSFADVAKTSQKLKAILHEQAQLSAHPLTYQQLEALDNICQKMARIVCGNSFFSDSWHDIAGYATLIEMELTE